MAVGDYLRGEQKEIIGRKKIKDHLAANWCTYRSEADRLKVNFSKQYPYFNEIDHVDILQILIRKMGTGMKLSGASLLVISQTVGVKVDDVAAAIAAAVYDASSPKTTKNTEDPKCKKKS